MLTVGSLFSGIGGLDLGLERAGMRVIWQCESDPFCRRVLVRHWPDITCYDDVRNVGDDTPRADLICGGFPCQPFSQAGARAVENDARYLWPEFARIIRVLQPRFVLLENVAGLLERGFGAVLGDLAACGYDAEWTSLPAAAFGAPQRRWRVFVVAYPHCNKLDECHRELQVFGKSPLWDYADGLALAQHRASEAAARVCGMDDGVPDRTHRNRALGNAVVPQVAEWIGRRILEAL